MICPLKTVTRLDDALLALITELPMGNILFKKKFWCSVFRWTKKVKKNQTLAHTTEHRHRTANSLPPSISDPLGLTLDVVNHNPKFPPSNLITPKKMSLPKGPHSDDISALPSAAACEPPMEELNDDTEVTIFQTLRARQMKLASSIPGLKILAPGEPQHQTLDPTPMQSGDVVLAPVSQSSLVFEKTFLPIQSLQRESLDSKERDSVNTDISASAFCPNKFAEPPADPLGRPFPPPTTPSAESTSNDGISTVPVPGPGLYDYNVTRCKPGYLLPHPASNRADRKAFAVSVRHKYLKNISMNLNTEGSEVSKINTIAFPKLPDPPTEPTTQPITAPKGVLSDPRPVLRSRYHSSPAHIPLGWLPPGPRHIYDVYYLSDYPPQPVGWVYIKTEFGPPPRTTHMIPAQSWGYPEGWYYSNDGLVLLHHRGPSPQPQELEECITAYQ